MNTITLKCNAKINLSLDVIGKRPDGYHNIELIFLEIPLYDTISVSLRNDGEIKLSCSDKTLPTDEKNIAYKAAASFFKAFGNCIGADIKITKNIPHGAGLAGGSADAAGVLKGLNSLLDNPLDLNTLMEEGKKLGADVPFCLLGGCAFAEGIGEILTPIKAPDTLHYILIKPDESISTAYVYQNLHLKCRPQALNVRLAANALNNDDIKAFYKYCGNIMESVTADVHPIIKALKSELLKTGASASLMSGSGTTVFGIYEDLGIANDAYEKLKSQYKKIWIF